MTPICLGKDPVEEHWYFYGEKGGVGRFIRYYVWKEVKYPQWARADQLPGILDITKTPPPEVLEEVEKFSKGLLSYEVIPKTRGRAERVIKSEVSSDGGTGGSSEASVERDDKSNERRRTSRVKPDVPKGVEHPQTDGNRKSLRQPDPKVKIKLKQKPLDVEVTKPAETPVEPTKRKRRTKAEMELVRNSVIPSVAKQEPVVVAAVEVKQKRTRRTKAEMEAYRKSLTNQEPVVIRKKKGS